MALHDALPNVTSTTYLTPEQAAAQWTRNAWAALERYSDRCFQAILDDACRQNRVWEEMEKAHWDALSPAEQRAELRARRWRRLKYRLYWPLAWLKELVLYGVRGRQYDDG